MVDALRSEHDLAEVRALLQLDATPKVGLRTLKRLVEEFGSARQALRAPAHLFGRVAGSVAVVSRLDPEVLTRVEHGLHEAERLEMTVCTWRDPLYPEAFHQLSDPPPVLFLRGDVTLLKTPSVTIVGARRATARGRDVAQRLGAALGRAGVTVTSGMALGIDGAAHRGALSRGGKTIAVLGRGADQAYPRTNRGLFEDIIAKGLVVSEFLPGTEALPHHFPRRNRLLAGLAHTIVVVEAAMKSGSLITVDHALDLGLDVYAIPGPIDEPSCEGSNALLADGATVLVSVNDFVSRVAGAHVAATAPPVDLSSAETAVYDGLADRPRHIEELAGQAGMEVPQALAVLTALELRGFVEQRPGLRFRRAS